MIKNLLSHACNSIALHLRKPKKFAVREMLAKMYLTGSGIEIGALHQPLKLKKGVHVKYVDRMSVEELHGHYPDSKDLNIRVDIVDNGEELSKFENNSLDFIIINHMLEHCQNPLGTVRNHLKKLKTGGILYISIPDKRHTFDVKRELTSFEHLVEDDICGPQNSRYNHFVEWSRFCINAPEEKIAERAQKLMARDFSIHFHVWDFSSFKDFLNKACGYLGDSFKTRNLKKNGREIIAILQKV